MTPSTKEALVESILARSAQTVSVSEMMRVYVESARIHYNRLEDQRLENLVKEQYPDLAELYLGDDDEN